MNHTREWSQACCPTESCERTSEEMQFNVVEVLRIVEELEHKAARFYLEAAERFADPDRRKIYYGLAALRARRREAWARIRREYSERTGEFGVFDPDNYVLSNPGVMASLTCFATPKSQGVPTGHETPEQIVRDAIRRSRGVVIFYEGLKGFAQNFESRTMIDRMIREENRHIHLLSRTLEGMRPERSSVRTADPGHSTEAGMARDN